MLKLNDDSKTLLRDEVFRWHAVLIELSIHAECILSYMPCLYALLILPFGMFPYVT